MYANDSSNGPRLYRSGGVEIDIAVADPSVTLVALDEMVGMGFLLSDSAEEGNVDRRLHLLGVDWIYLEGLGGGYFGRWSYFHDLTRRTFEDVSIYRHDTGVFVAKDEASGLYFPNPSVDPYAVVFISHEEHEYLREQIEQEASDRLMEAIGLSLAGVPGFAFDGESLVAPPRYAEARGFELEMPVMAR